MKIKVLFFVLAPIVIAWGCMYTRVQENGELLFPAQKARSWQIEVRARVTGQGRTGKIEFELPVLSKGFEIISENFTSDGYAVAILDSGLSRRAVWTGEIPREEEQEFFYKAVVKPRGNTWSGSAPRNQPGSSLDAQKTEALSRVLERLKSDGLSGHDFVEDLVKEVLLGNSKEAFTLRKGVKEKRSKRAFFLVSILRSAGVPARLVQGIKLASPDRSVSFFPWVEFFVDGSWHSIDVKQARTRIPRSWFPWMRDAIELTSIRGVAESDVVVSVNPLEFGPLNAGTVAAEDRTLFSFAELPVETQALYRIILVLPVGALLVAIFRCFIGIRTIGTFMPVLVAMSFRETELVWGLILYLAVIGVSLIARYCFEHLQLLVVPRLTATLTLVVLVIIAFTMTSENLNISRGLSVALFPIVILTMMVERISILFEEVGWLSAVSQTLITMCVSALIYGIIANDYVQYYMFAFPELLLVVLSFAIIIGRYTGFRLIELYRFRSLAAGNAK